MTEINKEAYKQAEKELLEKRVNEVKGLILETLEKIERKKKEKARIEEELRVLKLDIEDMKNGKFDKIEERIEKSKVARGVSIVVVPGWSNNIAPWNNPDITWPGLVSGTYTVNGRSFYI
jgi:predicted nuclease with TOPRIM domain